MRHRSIAETSAAPTESAGAYECAAGMHRVVSPLGHVPRYPLAMRHMSAEATRIQRVGLNTGRQTGPQQSVVVKVDSGTSVKLEQQSTSPRAQP